MIDETKIYIYRPPAYKLIDNALVRVKTNRPQMIKMVQTLNFYKNFKRTITESVQGKCTKN